MRTLIVSDLHLGARHGDLLRDVAVREALLREVQGASEVVLLGDVLELRHLPLGDAVDLARPLFEEVAEALDGGRILVVPGNHDHQIASPLIDRHRLRRRPLGPEQRFSPASGPLASIARRIPAEIELAYPGAWLRPEIYATHGHYLDCHLTVPTVENLAISTIARVTGVDRRDGGADAYEHAESPLYALTYAIAQGRPPVHAGSGPNPSARIWAATRNRRRRLRSWLIGGIAIPGAVWLANRAGLGPYASDLSLDEIGRAGVRAMREVVAALGVDAPHVVFGHTHRPGPRPREDWWALDGGGLLHNSGSWFGTPMLLGETPAESPFWPGTCIVVEDGGPPRLRRLLDDFGRDRLVAASRAT